MGKLIIFEESMIETLSIEEKAIFNSLVQKANAKTESENFDVKAYLERRKQNEAEEEQYRQQLEQSFV